MTANTTDKVAWNTAERLIMEIGNLRTKANYHYINRNVPVASRCLSAIKMCVVHSLKKEECDELNKLELDVIGKQIILDTYTASGFNKVKDKIYYDTLIEIDILYRKFNDYLQKLLETYGYLIEKKEDKTVLRF